jgi:hypothetical protein
MSSDSVSIDDQISCVRRELTMRKNTYPRWVALEKMSRAVMDREIARMEAVLVTLARVKQDAEPGLF